MRYLVALTGGVVAALLLLVFQNELISGERHIDPTPPVVIRLPDPIVPKPPETKEYREPRKAPEPPPRTDPPPATGHPEPPRVEPPRIPLAGFKGVAGGRGVHIGHDRTFGVPDGGLAPTILLEPQYPRDALRRRIEGEVEVAFTVLADGTVGEVEVIAANPPGIFEQAARRAVRGWQFLPRRVNGEPVSTRVRQVLEFRLPDE